MPVPAKKGMRGKKSKIVPLDVAAYIIELSKETGEPLTNMKLQKLIYYVYAWFAVEKKKPLFDEKILAWKYGPAIVSVYEEYKDYGADVVKDKSGGNLENLDEYTKGLTEEVFTVYGGKSAIDLMSLSHSEAPWRDTFNPDNQNTPIPFEKILEYYTARKNEV